MKRHILILFILVDSLLLFAQSSMSDLYKQWMIEDINNERYEKAANEIAHVNNWTFNPYAEKNVLLPDKVTEFISYLKEHSFNIYADSLSLYYAAEAEFISYYAYDKGNLQISLDMIILSHDLYSQVLGETHQITLEVLQSVSQTYYWLGDYNNSLKTLLHLIDVYQEIYGKDNIVEFLSVYQNLGIIYTDLGEYQNAEEIYLRVKNIKKEQNEINTHDNALLLNNLGLLYYYLGDYEKAEIVLGDCLVIKNKLAGNQNDDYAITLLNASLVSRSKNEYDKAEQKLLEVISIYDNTPNKKNTIEYVAVLQNLGELYYLTGELSKAKQIFLDELTLYSNIDLSGTNDYINRLYRYIAYICIINKDYQTAEGVLKKVLESHSEIKGTDVEYAQIANDLGQLYSLINIKLAKQYYLTAITILKNEYIKTNNYLSERQRRVFWKQLDNNFQSKYPKFIFNNYFENEDLLYLAYDNELFTKGLLLTSVNNIRQSILDSKDTTLIRQWEELTTQKQQIQVLQEKDPQSQYLSHLKEKAENLEKEVTRKSSAFRQSKDKWNITWDSVRNHLNKEQVAIEYMVAPLNEDSTMYCALLLRNNSQYPEMIPLFEEKEVLSLVNTSSENQTSYTYSFDGNGKQLSTLIWSKILPHIKQGETIYFAPSGLLHQLAIEALPYDENHTMADMFNLVRLSSTREIVLRKDEAPQSTATLYGGIKYDMSGDELLAESEQYSSTTLLASRGIENDTINRGTVSYLKGAKEEVENINHILKDNKLSVQLFTTTNANEESFKALSGKHQNILHIATHGFYWSDSTAQKKDYFSQRMLMMDDKTPTPPTIDPLNRCGLLFAGANTALSGHSADLPEGVQDGILTAKEISLLDLRDADLVVLSACETGKGEITGEGVFGLQRAFKQAGAQTIIMSLWPVNDAATQLLMTEFYRSWITNHQSKREAFCNAQNTVRSQYIEPAYWACFIMID